MGFSQANRHFLASKAALLLPLELDELQTRLQHGANTQNDSLEFQPLRQRSDSIASTPPPIPVQDLEKSSRQELIQNGGRPACSIQERSLTSSPRPWLDIKRFGHGSVTSQTRRCPNTAVRSRPKKRKQRDEEEPSESQRKRTTRRDGRANAGADAVPDMSHLRRSTRLSARRAGVND